MADTRRRVKLYALNADRQWDDRGTGHVSSSYVDRHKAMSLLVRAESDGSLLLESKIQQDTAYQKQQETLIVWSEGDNYDLALSFQEKAGCDEIWEKICQVQGKDPSVDITQDVVESEDERLEEGADGGPGSSSLPPVELPPCEASRLEELCELLQSCLPSPMRRDKLATALEEQDYVRRLLALFRSCEQLDDRQGLHQLYDIFKGMFLLNKNALFDAMFAEDAILDVVGVLEYEPGGPQRRRHRDYLCQVSRFREVIPLGNPELLAKIHQTYRVQYIQDVVLPTPSVFEENMLSTLSSFIFFNKADIVSMLQEDEKFLSELFAQLTDEATDDDKRRDLVLFLKEFCTFSQTLQPQCRESFFKTLSSLGILQALEITLGMEDPVIKTASIDILSYLVDYSPSMVREYAFQQSNMQDDDQLLINVIIEQMICDPDPELGGAVQLSGILRLLLDPENMLSLDTKSEFLNFFYKHCMHVLIAPVLANTTGDAPSRECGQTAQLLGLIVELLSFCVEHHSYHIKNYVLHKDLLRRVLVLMRSKFTFLVLCALRFMRRIVGLKDEFYNRYIVNGNLFGPVVDAFRRNEGRYNLLDSAVLELFEFIRVDDVKTLCLHVVDRYGKVLDKVDYVQTFKSLRLRYEQHQERLKERPSLESMPSILRGGGVVGGGPVVGTGLGVGGAGRFRRDPRQLEEDEEMWFNDEEEDLEEPPEGPGGTAVGAGADSFSRRLDAEFDQLGKILDKKAQEREGKENVRTLNRSGSPVLNNSAGRRSPSNPAGGPLSPTTVVEVKSPTGSLPRKGGLVDYPDEDSDEEEEEEEGSAAISSPKRPRLSS
ncbi:serine/threonine-protein phosphatase 4 regulatory subunit 3 isoform X1 [Ixodes scapularis]|nr:serine/threonine-protein phosphatase 4 regulatory subunit 3 isoform X1 [Ixodes scapularis]XP_029849645.1 serine/threonine-protein phosphatase 4 regulatory subunit 3 isoform X1 [Ixodes scapularis]XP_040356444.1 serine/threonine-protein phosphatase 4 regulatory subunit 3 isoform X1 [Ixodes scapularis]